ncbi:CvpA family protein [Acidiferrobacter sp.]|uniref:CvpA family protein n=1 Tax=Acidiferrobacter sp. TaxID=1872107 RepID=UPI0026271EA8|nr:CvpA family protein [Acidiferrobacter sp.]
MSWVDIVIVLVIGLFVLVGVLRGFISEVLSFLTWVLSFLVAWLFSGDFTGWFAGHVKDANLRSVLVFFLFFFVTFVILVIVSHFIREAWFKVSSRAVDRLLGGAVGFVKGALVIVLMVLLAGLTPFPGYPSWRGSLFVGYFQGVALYMAHWLPADVARSLRYG